MNLHTAVRRLRESPVGRTIALSDRFHLQRERKHALLFENDQQIAKISTENVPSLLRLITQHTGIKP